MGGHRQRRVGRAINGDVDAGSVEAGAEIWPTFSTVVDEGEQN
jgi:hypothetical protein